MLSFLQSSFPELYQEPDQKHEVEQQEEADEQGAHAAVPLPDTHPAPGQQLLQHQHKRLGAEHAQVEVEQHEGEDKEAAGHAAGHLPDQYQQKVDKIRAKVRSRGANSSVLLVEVSKGQVWPSDISPCLGC